MGVPTRSIYQEPTLFPRSDEIGCVQGGMAVDKPTLFHGKQLAYGISFVPQESSIVIAV